MHDRQYVLNELEKHKKDAKNRTINLNDRIFEKQYFKKDICKCIYHHGELQHCIDKLLISVESVILTQKNTIQNTKLLFEIHQIFKLIHKNLNNHKCIMLELKILSELLKKKNIMIPFSMNYIEILDFFAMHDEHL
jgi:hypothetical protein